VRWLAYQSDESGQNQIYVQSFPGPGGKWQVSNDGGTQPRWNRNGKELFYIAADSKLMSVAIETTGASQLQGLHASRVVCNTNRTSPSGYTTTTVRRFPRRPALRDQCPGRKRCRFAHYRGSELESRREEMTLTGQSTVSHTWCLQTGSGFTSTDFVVL
jgi:hypothetical protein